MDNNDLLKIFGINVKRERLRLGYTQEEFAEILNFHEKHISKIETGHQNVTLKTLSKIAKALDVEESVLLENKSKRRVII